MSRIIVACKSNTDYTNVMNALNKNDYSVFARATTSFELTNLVKTHDPDAVIIFGKLDNSTHYIDSIIDFNHCPVIVINNQVSESNYYNLQQCSRFYFLEDVGFDMMINSILKLLIKVNKEVSVLSKKVDKLETQNETLKLVSRAKFYLVEHKSLTEDEAHKLINDLSMKHRLPKASIAKKILNDKI